MSPGAGFAVLPTVGGQTALNLAIELSDGGVLEKYNATLIGANVAAIKKAEDRLFFKDAMQRIGLDVPKSALVNNTKDGIEFAGKIEVMKSSPNSLNDTHAMYTLRRHPCAETNSSTRAQQPVPDAPAADAKFERDTPGTLALGEPLDCGVLPR